MLVVAPGAPMVNTGEFNGLLARMALQNGLQPALVEPFEGWKASSVPAVARGTVRWHDG